jgi:hypothetical protein
MEYLNYCAYTGTKPHILQFRYTGSTRGAARKSNIVRGEATLYIPLSPVATLLVARFQILASPPSDAPALLSIQTLKYLGVEVRQMARGLYQLHSGKSVPISFSENGLPVVRWVPEKNTTIHEYIHNQVREITLLYTECSKAKSHLGSHLLAKETRLYTQHTHRHPGVASSNAAGEVTDVRVNKPCR